MDLTKFVIPYFNSIKTLIDSYLVPLLLAVAFIVFLYGIAKAYIFSGASDEARKSGHQLALWGIIGFVIMISVWGIVNIATATLIPTAAGTNAPATPKL